MTARNRQFVLAARPRGLPTAEDVPLVETDVPVPREGQILVRNLYVSLDPATRGWMSDQPSYLPPIRIGAPVRATTVGRVTASRHPDHSVGDLVLGLGGWSDYTVRDGRSFERIPASGDHPLPAYLYALGYIGLTAYAGLLDVGRPRPGETVLVSAAAGATGSLVGQIARIAGCRTVGIAGGAEKCRQLLEDYGYDRAVDYRAAPTDIAAAIGAACPTGIDVYFDNVGGAILDAALLHLNRGARIVMCGAIGSYNATGPVPGPCNLWQILARRARLQGFLAMDYLDWLPKSRERLGEWIRDGRLRCREEIVEGLEHALTAFRRLFDGSHAGKLIVKVADP
jgi:hypothetical protein